MEPASKTPFKSLLCHDNESEASAKDGGGAKEIHAKPMVGDLAAVLRKSLNIVERGEELTHPMLYETIRALTDHGTSKYFATTHQQQPCVGSVGDVYNGSDNLFEIDHLPPISDWTDMMISKQNDEYLHNPDSDEVKKMEDIKQKEPGVESADSIQQMPLTTVGDFITTTFDSNQSPNEKSADTSKAWQGPAKKTGDLRQFITFAEKVQTEWKQDVCEATLLGDDLSIQGQGSQEKMLLYSVWKFIEWLKDVQEERSNTLKFQFGCAYDRMVWVLKHMDKLSSVAEIVRMLILCSVVVKWRGPYRNQDQKGASAKKPPGAEKVPAKKRKRNENTGGS